MIPSKRLRSRNRVSFIIIVGRYNIPGKRRELKYLCNCLDLASSYETSYLPRSEDTLSRYSSFKCRKKHKLLCSVAKSTVKAIDEIANIDQHMTCMSMT